MADERNVTLRGLMLGDVTDYPFAARWIAGLGVPAARTFDQPRGHLSGDVGGDDVLPKRVITLSGAVDGTEKAVEDGTTKQEAAFALLEALRTAWCPSYQDIALLVEIGDYWERTYYGRPRGVDADMERACDGIIRYLLTFEALRPYAEGETVDVVVGVEASPTLIANPGNAPLNDRWVMTLTPTAGTIRIHQAAQDEPDLVIDGTGVSELVVTGYDRAVFDGPTYDIGRVQPGSGWMQLVPGNQTITVTGATYTLSFPALYL